MNNFTKALTSVAILAAASASADTILGVYAGAQGWNMDTSGGFANGTNLTNFEFEKETKSSFFVALEHPVPLIPNIKLIHTTLDTGGDVDLTTNFTFNGELFPVNSALNTDISLTATDIVLYYEILDNDLISIDLGLTAKLLDGEILVADKADPSLTTTEEFSGPVPMLYGRVEVGIPATSLAVYAEGNFLSVDDSSLTDFQVALEYEFVDNAIVDMTLQLGYRSMTLELDDVDDIYSDLDFDGPFAGVEVHF